MDIDSCQHLYRLYSIRFWITNSLNLIVFVATVRLCDNDHVDENCILSNTMFKLMNVKWLLQMLEFIFCFFICVFFWCFHFSLFMLCDCTVLCTICSIARKEIATKSYNDSLEWLLTRNIDRMKWATWSLYMKLKA